MNGPTRCPNCGRRQGWDGHAYAPCKRPAAARHAAPMILTAGAVWRSGYRYGYPSPTRLGLDALRYRGRHLAP